MTALRVLLVDDSDAVRITMGAIFEMMGHEVLLAETVAEARQLQGEGVYDVAVLDVHVGDDLGTDLIPELRVLQPRAVIAMLSGNPSAEAIDGADFVLAKGEDPEAIVKRLEQAVAARRSV